MRKLFHFSCILFLLLKDFSLIEAFCEDGNEQVYPNLILGNEQIGRHFLHSMYNPLRPYFSTPFSSSQCIDNVWVEAQALASKFDDQDLIEGFHTTGFELSTGAQTSVCENAIFGAAVAFESDLFNFCENENDTEYSIFGGLYGLYRPSDYYFLAEWLIGASFMTVHRKLIADDEIFYCFKGKPNSVFSTIYMEVGKDISTCYILLQPFFGIEENYYNYQRVKEHGFDLFSLNLPAHTYWSTNSRLGLHAYTKTIWDFFSIVIDTAWVYRWTPLHNRRIIELDVPNTCSFIDGISFSQNRIDLSLTFLQQIHCGSRWYVQVAGEGWSNAITGSLTAGWIFDW